ncbi:MAG: response regulator [Opitutaceae bacterium]|nr:response regulator [Opitutaceae bacterium]
MIDDDESVCRSLDRLLRTVGYRALTYSSAEAFLEDAKRPSFDCLVLDVQLGAISGLELSRRLASVKDPTPVIFITAHSAPKIREEAEAVGCAGFFRKTDPGDKVIEAIDRAIERSGEKRAAANKPGPASAT